MSGKRVEVITSRDAGLYCVEVALSDREGLTLGEALLYADTGYVNERSAEEVGWAWARGNGHTVTTIVNAGKRRARVP